MSHSGSQSDSSQKSQGIWKKLEKGYMEADSKNQRTWSTNFFLEYRPSWEDLLTHSKNAYNHIYDNWSDDFRKKTNTALVATLCIVRVEEDYKSFYHIFQSTIPRGKWRDHMLEKGSFEAPKWWNAANSEPRNGSPRLVPHAEDSVEYLANQYYGPTFNIQ